MARRYERAKTETDFLAIFTHWKTPVPFVAGETSGHGHEGHEHRRFIGREHQHRAGSHERFASLPYTFSSGCAAAESR
jgi:hypothetical protein